MKMFDQIKSPQEAVNIDITVAGRTATVHCAIMESENFDSQILIGNDYLEAVGLVIDYARKKLYFLENGPCKTCLGCT